MNKKTLGVVGLLVLLAGGYLVYSKFIAKDKAPKEAASEATGDGDADKKPAAELKSSSSDRVAPPMAQPQIQMDDDPEGTLRLEGQVIDDAGVGVPKATVTLSSNPPRTATAEEGRHLRLRKADRTDLRP